MLQLGVTESAHLAICLVIKKQSQFIHITISREATAESTLKSFTLNLLKSDLDVVQNSLQQEPKL